MGYHSDEKLQCTLQHQRAIVRDVSENEEGVDASDDVTPAGKVSDDALK